MIKNKNTDLIRAIKHHGCNGSGNVTLETLSVTENGEYNSQKGKAWNKVNVNVQGSGGGTFNVNDIVLKDAQTLWDMCSALEYDNDGMAGTDWTFSDLCIQDSCGVLRAAFEDSFTDDSDSGVVVFRRFSNSDALGSAVVDLKSDGMVVTNSSSVYYQINFDSVEKIYCVYRLSKNIPII